MGMMLHPLETDQCRFPTEKAGFALMLVVGEKPEEVKSSGASRHGVRGVIGDMAVLGQRTWCIREMTAFVGICHEEGRRESSKRNHPCSVRETNMCRTRPHADLIVEKC